MEAAAAHRVVGVPAGVRGRAARLTLLGASPLMALMFAALGPVVPTIADHFGGRTGVPSPRR